MGEAKDFSEIEALFNKAVKLHTDGSVGEAAEIYQKILNTDPRHADSIHLLGLAKHQMGESVQGSELIRRAIEIRPSEAAYYSNLGAALKAQDRMEEAAESYERAVEIDDKFLPAYYNVGEIYCLMERLEEGETAYRRALELNNSLPDIWGNLGLCLIRQEKFEDAEECLIRSLGIMQDFGPSLYGLGHLRELQEKPSEAMPFFQQAMNAGFDRPSCLRRLASLAQAEKLDDVALDYLNQLIDMGQGDASVYNNLALVYRDCGDESKAQVAFDEALKSDPDHVETLCNLADLRASQGEFANAIELCEHCLSVDPECDIAYNNLALALRGQTKVEEAIEAYRNAIDLDPDQAKYRSNIALLLDYVGKTDEMEEQYKKAIELDPNYSVAYANYASSLLKFGRLSEAKELLDRSLNLNPDQAITWSDLGRYYYEIGDFSKSGEAYEKCLELDPENRQGLTSLAATQIIRDDVDDAFIFDLHKRTAAKLEGDVEQISIQDLMRSRAGSDKLRVGFVSADFRRHSVAYFIEPLLENLDRERFAIHCYSGVIRKDTVTDRIEKLADKWMNVANVSQEVLASRIREDGIDVLIDLSGYTHGNNCLVFAARSAPVQASYLGYPHSSGMDSMSHRIVDAVTDPDGMTLNTEELARMPHCFLCYRPAEEYPEVGSLPATDAESITFGSFNNITKLTNQSIDLFAKTMNAVPGSRLLLKSHQTRDKTVRERTLARFEANGISGDRIEFLLRMPSMMDHLDTYNRIDIGLDTYPYNGTTTTCEAMWMGVPVLTMSGTRHASRVSASIANVVGLGEMVADSEETFVAKAVALASDRERLAVMRSGLRSKMEASPLCNESGFAKDFGDLLESMFKNVMEGNVESVG